MAYKILTKNGVDNTNTDGARNNNFTAGKRSGVSKGVLNECAITSPTSTSLAIDTGEIRLCGHIVVINEAETITLNNTPSTAQNMALVAQIVVDSEGVPAFSFVVQNDSQLLVKDNLDSSLTGTGTYQLKLATFTQNTDSTITSIINVVEKITGSNSGNVIANILLTESTNAVDITDLDLIADGGVWDVALLAKNAVSTSASATFYVTLLGKTTATATTDTSLTGYNWACNRVWTGATSAFVETRQNQNNCSLIRGGSIETKCFLQVALPTNNARVSIHFDSECIDVDGSVYFGVGSGTLATNVYNVTGLEFYASAGFGAGTRILVTKRG